MLVALLGAVALVLVLLVAALQGLKTESARRRIAAALSDAMGRPVAIGRLSATLLPQPALTAGASPTKVSTLRLWEESDETSSSRTPGVARTASAIPDTTSRLRPSVQRT